MRLVDADLAMKCLTYYGRGNQKTFMRCILISFIQSLPTVDAVHVIRCKDCKWYEEQDESIGTCLLTESGAHIKGYCAWAERKEE